MQLITRITALISLILLLAACAGVRPNVVVPRMPPRPPQLRSQPRVALVLGSGGARGYAHLGVLEVLQNAGVPLDLIVGASSGSIFGAVYSDNHSASQTYNIFMKAGFWNFADVNNYPHESGFIEGYHLEKFLLHNMHARDFRQLKNKFVATSTDLSTGNAYIIQSGPIAPAVLASAALPGLIDPVRIYQKILIDGGVAQPIPVQVAKSFHPKLIIAVNIDQELNPRVPLFSYNIYSRAYDIIWHQLSNENVEGANIVIRPHVGQEGTFSLQDRYQLYLEGRRAALQALPGILAQLKLHHIKLHSPSIKMVP